MDLTETQHQQLVDLVDESDYSLDDWRRALAAFDQWLSENEYDSRRPVETMLGYIHCCTMTTASTLPSPDLAELVRESLAQYGFDATRSADPEADGESGD